MTCPNCDREAESGPDDRTVLVIQGPRGAIRVIGCDCVVEPGSMVVPRWLCRALADGITSHPMWPSHLEEEK